ncbi:MAG: substrate-binding domain-containing protein [Magnetococcales bacterium]|nr:substrate-binding domain-containing protein [Magnetococcales bacterium]
MARWQHVGMVKHWIAGLLFFMVISPLQGADERHLAPAFSDPKKIAQRSEEWQSRSIQHASWAEKADLALTLDQHQYGALNEVIQQFGQKNGWHIATREGNCGTSESMLDKKQVDIAGFCCPPATDDRLPGLKYHTLGIAALAILVHRDNQVKNMTEEEVRGVFSGKISNWSQLAGAGTGGVWDQPVRPVGRLHCATRPGHWRTILADENEFSSRLVEVGTIPDMIAAIATDPKAIGYEVLWNIRRFDTKGLVRPVDIGGVSPEDDQAVATGLYPFYQVVNVSTWESDHLRNTKANRLIDHLKGQIPILKPLYKIVSQEWLRKNGWRFAEDELIGRP